MQSLFLDTIVVSELLSWHNLCFHWRTIAMLHSEEDEPLTERDKRYQNRSQKKFDYTTDDQDKGKAPKTASDKEGEERNLLVAMQDLAREIKEMILDRMRESLGRFHPGC